MSEEFRSTALRAAELRSERLRIFGVRGFVAVFVGVTIARVFVIRTASTASPRMWSLLLAAAIAAYENWTLRQLGTSLKTGARRTTGVRIVRQSADLSGPAV